MNMETVILNQNLSRFTVFVDPSAGRYRTHYAFVSSAWLDGRCTILHRSLVHSAETCSFLEALIDHVMQTRRLSGVRPRAIADIFVESNLKPLQTVVATQLGGTSLENYNFCQLGQRTPKPTRVDDLSVFSIVGSHINEDELHYFQGALQTSMIV